MAIIRKKLDNLKPGKQYILTVRTKDNDINTVANLAESIRFTVPQDSTIPDTITNLQLYASFEKVMFVFNFSADPDISRYEYELYSDPNIEVATPPLASKGFNAANVFTVAVPNSYTEDSGGNFNTIAKSYWGRIRGIDTTGNAGPWTVLVKTDDDTPLIDSQYIDNLTASKITAGTIGAHTIQLNGANSILRSSNYEAGTAGWIIKGDGSAEFRNVNIGGNSTIDGLDVNALEDAIANFNNRNDRISTIPATPGMVAAPSSIEHTISTGGSANISFEWTYDGSGDAYNIDGFFLYVKSATTSAGVATAIENVYAITSEKRAAILYGVPSDHFYSFSIQAYRIVDTDINVNGILKSSTASSSQNPYRPTTNVQFSGDITGTIGGVNVNTVVANANAGATVAQNFNANNDRNGTTPTTPVVATNGTAVDYTENQDGSANISFEWEYTTSPTPTAVNNIDGFIVYVRQSATSEVYTFGGANAATEETVYYVSSDKRAMVFPGVPSNNYYTFGVRAYRLVDTDIDTSGMKMSALVKATGTSPEGRTENPFRPVDNVKFTGDVTGTINGTSASTVVSGAAAGAAVATNFNANNDRNATTPTAPVILTDGTAVDHTLNTDGSANISLEWTYTSSSTPTDSSNIDGFIVTMRASTSSSAYTFGSSPAEETIYYVSPEKRAIIFSGVPANLYYTFGVRAYRVVDSDIDSSGLKLSAITKAQGTGENPYRPSATVAFAGDVTGTIGSTPASTLVSQAQSGAAAAANFNTNNDQSSAVPTAPTILTDGTAIDHTQNTDGSVDISFEWQYTNSTVWNDPANIDGFIISVYSSAPGVSTSYTMGTNTALETNFYSPATSRSFFLQGVPANRHYTIGVRAYRLVNTNINAAGVLVSPYAQSSRAEENPYLPSATVAFSGSLVGTSGAVPVATVISNADAGFSAATNFNNNNDRNSTTPTAPTILANGEAVDHTLNTDGSANISFEWDYTTSVTPTAANNIDGFIVYVYSSTSSSAYNFGTSPLLETIYYVTADKRSIIFSGVPANLYYTFGVRAYRSVDTDIDSSGLKLSTITKTTGTGENPYLPSANVAFAGNITGTIANVPVTTVVANANLGATVSANFNANNDRNSTTPTSPVVAVDGTAVDHTLNSDGSANISFEWSYTTSSVATAANNIDGFIVYVRSSTSSASYTFGASTEEATYFLPSSQRAIVLSGVPANYYYTFGVRAYRSVDSDIDSAGMKVSPIIKASIAEENPYRPSATIAFDGNLLGTINNVPVANLIANANSGATAAQNFNTNNDRNSTTPTAPVVLTDGTAVDHTLNTDGSANISFEWQYTTSNVWSDVNNIDGFIVYMRQSASNQAYTFGGANAALEETVYYVSADKRAIVFPGVPANQYYNFAVRAYRFVDSGIDASGMKLSTLVAASGTAENPYQPSATVAFAGDITGTVAGVQVSALVTNASLGATAAQNFNINNDRNGTTPTSPVVPNDGTAVDHTLNTDGSADISFEWTYTTSATPSSANNIDGFIVYVRAGSTSSPYTFGSNISQETTYYLTSDRRAIILSGVPANLHYTFGVRAYRLVDTDIDSTGMKLSPIIYALGTGENPYQPSSTVAFSGSIVGTVGPVPAANLVANANLGATAAQNFNANNDRNGVVPTTPTIPTDGTSVDHTLNTDGSANISFEWNYTVSTTPTAANNIDGFVVYMRQSTSSGSYNFGDSPAEETTFFVPAEKRAIIFPGVPANQYYTFGVRAYRYVDTDIATSGMLMSPIVKPAGTNPSENPYLPSATVAFAGDITGTIASTPASTVVNNALRGSRVAQNFYANNDQNALTPPTPTIPNASTALEYVRNTDGSVDISLDWTYTTSSIASNAANIDGFIISVVTGDPGAGSLSYTMGSNPSIEVNYFVSADSRTFILPGVASDRFYAFGLRAYRMVDNEIRDPNTGAITATTNGIITSLYATPSYTNTYPYRPSTTVPFAGDITGTINNTPASTVVNYAIQGNLAATNFFANNDQNATTPTAPTVPTGGVAIDHVQNTDGSVDISFEWAYTTSATPTDANNIDGFMISVYSSDPGVSTPYVMGTNKQLETNYYAPPDSRAFFLQGVPANRHYTFGVRAYRIVDSNINSTGMLTSTYAQSGVAGENPYLPSATVAFSGSLLGTVGLVPVANVISNANAGATAAQNFNANNDRNATVPPVPVVPTDGTAVDYTQNTDGSVNISFEWTYTTSNVATDANNIDGFIVYMRQSATSEVYTFGGANAAIQETVYYISADKRAIVFPGVPADQYYTFGVRAYRYVDTDISTPGIIMSAIVKAQGTSPAPESRTENPFRPLDNVAFAGNVTGTINNIPAATVVSNASAGFDAATNFNKNNDRNATAPTDPGVPTDGSAVDHTLNVDGSANISFEWTYTTSATPSNAANIDGFIVYVYSSTSSASYNFGTTPALETIYYTTADKRSIILPGVPANLYYTFGVRSYRLVDTDIDSSGMKLSSIIKATAASLAGDATPRSENPYQPSANIAFAGDITGTIGSTPASIVVDNARRGSRVAQNFYANNDQNAQQPPKPTIANAATALEFVRNLNGSVDISLDWSYTSSSVATDANNIDGFIISVVSAEYTATPPSYTMGSNPSVEVNYFASPDSRTFVLAGVASEKHYFFGVRAYRIVDNEIRDKDTGAIIAANTGGMITSVYETPPYAGAYPFLPSLSVPFAGNVTGTIASTPASTIASFAYQGNRVSQNFFTNNDQNDKTPDAPTLLTNGTAIDHTRNGNGSVDISFEWDYPLLSDVWDNKNNIDGFIVTSYSSENSVSYITLPGSTGNYASIPNNSAIDLTGDIDVRVRLALDAYGVGSARTLAAKWTDLGSNNRSWLFRIGLSGRLELVTSSDGIEFLTHTSTINPVVTNGQTYWFRVTIDVADGANRTVRFYVNPDSASEPNEWIPLGDPVPGDPPRVTSLFNSAANLTVGCHNGSFNGLAPGKYYRVILRNGIGGPAVADLDFTRVSTTGQASLTAITGQTITLFRSGSPSLTATPGSYTITGDGPFETNYYVPRTNKAFILPGVASDRFYTFGIRAYRLVDSNISSSGVIMSPIAQITTAGDEHPYKPEATVAFTGNILGTIGGVPAPTIVDNSSQGLLVAQNYFANNDQNTVKPTAPGIPASGVALDHVENDNATVDISFEWTYTTSATPSAANNIDGFIVSIYSSNPDISSNYLMGATPNLETNYYVPADRRSFFLQGVASNRYYTFGVRAYRIVDSIVNGVATNGIVISDYAQSLESGEHPYRPSANVAYRGSLVGTIGATPALIPVVDIVNGITNFNSRNDRNGIKPGTPTNAVIAKANNLGATLDLVVDWDYSLPSTGSQWDIDGFILYLDSRPGIKITSAAFTAGPDFIEYTTESAHGFVNGDIISISGCVPSNYNKTSVSVSSVTANTFRVLLQFNPGTFSSGGYAAKYFTIPSSPPADIQQVYLTPERRGYTFTGMPPEYTYVFAVRAFRVVDSDVYNAYVGDKFGSAIFGDILVSSPSNSTTPTLGGSDGISIGNGKIYIGAGNFGQTDTGFFVDKDGRLSLKNKLTWNGTTLNIQGNIVAESGHFSGNVSFGSGGGSKIGLAVNSTNDGIYFNDHNYWYTTSSFKIGNEFHHVSWNGTTLSIKGDITSTATISGGTLVGAYIKTAVSNSRIELNGARMSIINPLEDLKPSSSVIQFYPSSTTSYGAIRSTGGIRLTPFNDGITVDANGNIVESNLFLHIGGGAGSFGINNGIRLTPNFTVFQDGTVEAEKMITAKEGLSSNTWLQIQSAAPTLYLRDTNNRSSMIHCNSNVLYFLRGSGNDSTTWATTNSRWPLELDLETNNAQFGRDIRTGPNGWFTSDASGTHALIMHSHSGAILLSNFQETTSITNTEDLRWGTTMGNLLRLTSSREAKENIQTLADSYDVGSIIDALRPVSFIAKATGINEDPKVKEFREADINFGFIAEEVFEVADGRLSVVSDENGELKPRMWKTYDMISVLVAEVQNLRKRVLELEGLV